MAKNNYSRVRSNGGGAPRPSAGRVKASSPRGRAAATPTTFGGKFQRAAEAALQNRLFVICFAIIVLVGIALIIGLLLDDSSAAASVLLDRAANLQLRPVPLG